MQIRENTLFNFLILGFLFSLIIGNGIYFLEPRLNQDIELVPGEMGPQYQSTHIPNGSFVSRSVFNRQSKSADSQLIITNIKIIKKEVCRLEERPTSGDPNYFKNISVCIVPENPEEVPNVTIRIDNRSLSYKIPPFKSLSYHFEHVAHGNPAKEIEDVFQFRNLVRLNFSLIVDGKEFNETAQIETQSSNLDIRISTGVSSISGTFEYRINQIKSRYKYFRRDIRSYDWPLLFLLFPMGELTVYAYLLGSTWIFLLLPFRPLTILMALVLGKVLKNKNKATVISIGIYYLWWILIIIFIGLAMSQSTWS